jgi:hypothetical protein
MAKRCRLRARIPWSVLGPMRRLRDNPVDVPILRQAEWLQGHSRKSLPMRIYRESTDSAQPAAGPSMDHDTLEARQCAGCIARSAN